MKPYFDERDPGDEDPKAHILSQEELAFLRRRIAEGLPKPLDYGTSPLRAAWRAYLIKQMFKKMTPLPGYYPALPDLSQRDYTLGSGEGVDFTMTYAFDNSDPGDEHRDPPRDIFVWFTDFTERAACALGLPREYLMPPNVSTISYRWEGDRLVVTHLVMPHDINIKYEIPKIYFGHDEG